MGKLLLVGGIILLVLGGTVTVGLGLIGPMLIDEGIDKAVKDALVLGADDWDEQWTFDANQYPTTDDMGDGWLYNGPGNTETAPTWDSFYMYNITNYNPQTGAFVGTVPIYNEVGPFVARKVDHKTVDAYANGRVTYNESNWYIADEANASGLLTADSPELTDVIVSWNPLYYSYVAAAGGEDYLHYGLAQSLMNGTIWQMAATFNASGQDLPTSLAMAKAQWGNLTYSALSPSLPTGTEAAYIVQYVLGAGMLNMSATEVDTVLYNANKNYALAENVTWVAAFRATYAINTTLYAGLYGITTTQVMQLGGFCDAIASLYMWGEGVSLVAPRTFGQWIFGIDPDTGGTWIDPVAEVPFSLFDNDTSIDGGKRLNTGSNNIDDIWDEETEAYDYGLLWKSGYPIPAQFLSPNSYESFSANSVMGTLYNSTYNGLPAGQGPGFWKTTEEVHGTDATHFAPDVSDDDTLLVWNSDTMRQLDFVYTKDTTIRGVDALRFHLDPAMLDVDDNYFQYFKGYANMSAWKAGLPIYLCQPHYQDSQTVSEEYDIIVDIEPNTGAVLQGHKRLQFNLLVANSTFNHFFDDINGSYYTVANAQLAAYLEPMGWIDRFASAEQLPDDEWADVKGDLDDLKSAKELSGLLGIAGLGGGLVLFAAGAAMVIVPKFMGGKPGE